MKSNIYIPKKIKVGFQRRLETYTGKLAYVVYFDDKGKLRKESSWESWRDKKIPAVEFDNTPINGFIFNKNIQRIGLEGYFSGSRSMMRVYDPRDFEFEITMDNLSGILMNSDISKSEINDQCVFAWSGQDLLLIPVSSEEYKNAIAFTDKQSQKISTKELIKGATYEHKKISYKKYIYLGFFNFIDVKAEWNRNSLVEKGKKHVFAVLNENSKNFEFENTTISSLSACLQDEAHEKYSEYIISFEHLMKEREEKLYFKNKVQK